MAGATEEGTAGEVAASAHPAARTPARLTAVGAGRLAADAGAVAILLVLWLVPFRGLFAGAVLHLGELHESLYPYHHAAALAAAAGERPPLFRPEPFFGYPWFANPQNLAFQPAVWWTWCVPSRTAWALSLTIALHLLWGALGMYALLRRGLGASAPAALLAASVALWNGHAAGNLEQLHGQVTLAWWPWTAWAVLAALAAPSGSARRARSLAFGALAFGLGSLGGMTQQSAYGVLPLVALALASRAATGTTAGHRLRLLLGVLAVGSLLFAVQLVPTLDLLARAARSAGTADAAWSRPGGSLAPADVPGILFPNLQGFGSWSATSTWFVGIGAAALAASWLGPGLSRRRPESLALLAAAAGAVVVAAGPATPLARVLAALPGGTLFQDPVRALSVVVFCVAALAGLALDRLAVDAAQARSARVAFAVLASLAAVAGQVARGAADGGLYAGDIALPAPRSLVGAAVLAGCAGWVLLGAWAGEPSRDDALRWLVATAAALHLAWMGSAFVALRPERGFERPPAPEDLALVERGAAVDPLARWVRLGPAALEGVLLPPFETEVRFPTTTGFSSLVPARVLAFTRGTMDVDPYRHASYADFLDAPALVSASGVRFALDRAPPGLGAAAAEVAAGGGPERARWTERERRGDHVLLEWSDPRPFAYVVGGARRASSPEQALSWLAGGAIDLDHEVVLEGEGPAARGGGNDPDGSGARPGVAVELGRDRVAVTLDPPATGGWLVILVPWERAWRARAGAAERPLVRANVLFSAVALAPGDRRVELVYVPGALAVGALGTGLGLLAVVIGLVAPWSRS